MRFVNGPDLAAVLAAEGRLRPYRAIDVCRQVGAALDAAHEVGLIHRDVKPANVLIEGRDAFLTDFGLAKRLDGAVRADHHRGRRRRHDPLRRARADRGPRGDRPHRRLLARLRALPLPDGRLPYPRDGDVAIIYAHLSEAPPKPSQARAELPAGARPGDREGARQGAGAPLRDLRRPDGRRARRGRRGRPAEGDDAVAHRQRRRGGRGDARGRRRRPPRARAAGRRRRLHARDRPRGAGRARRRARERGRRWTPPATPRPTS